MKPMGFKLRFWLGLAVAATVLVVPATAQADNVVPNPGFEIAKCSNLPPEPEVCGWGSWHKIDRVTTNPHSGEASMVLTCTDCQGDYAWAVSDCVPITPGTHAASFWYRQSGLTWWGALGLEANFYSDSRCIHGFVSRDLIVADATFATEWTQVSGTLSGKGTFAYFALSVGWCDFVCSAAFWFDDIYVEGAGLGSTPVSRLQSSLAD